VSELRLPGGSVQVVRADITRQRVDAIVNAANAGLAGGGGVDGAIHLTGGPEIMAETRRLFPDGCATGGAVTTGAGALPARYVIHAVGPRWQGGGNREEELLASAWRSALYEAVEHGCRSVAIPSIATGSYGFPVRRAAELAAAEVWFALERLEPERSLDVTICAFTDADREAYATAVAKWVG
jgi:O-acetyl-ADP-ribose deacetylase (regulator of RNase III)